MYFKDSKNFEHKLLSKPLFFPYHNLNLYFGDFFSKDEDTQWCSVFMNRLLIMAGAEEVDVCSESSK